MDAQAVNSAEKIQVPVPRPNSSSGGSRNTVPPSGSPASDPTDTVSLSQQGQKAGSARAINNSGSELRRLVVTDDNQVIVTIVDARTQRVVRQTPPEEAVRLRQAIQESLESLSESGDFIDTNI